MNKVKKVEKLEKKIKKLVKKLRKVKGDSKPKIKNMCEICDGDGYNPYYSSHVCGSEKKCPACGGAGTK